MARPTRLGFLVSQRHLQPKRFASEFNDAASRLFPDNPATVSPRTVRRWIALGVKPKFKNVEAGRVLEEMFGEPLESLLSEYVPPPDREKAPRPECAPAGRGLYPFGSTPTTDFQDVMSMAANESARAGQFAEETNVGPRTIEQLHADLGRIATDYPHSGVQRMFYDAYELNGRIFELLRGRQHPRQRTDLHLLAAGSSAILANASFDLGAFEHARTHARAASTFAELIGHNGMQAWIHGMEALIAHWNDQPKLAVQLATQGWTYTPEYGTARIRLACIEARAHARLRDPAAAEAAMARAEEAHEAAHGDDDPAGMLAFPPAKHLLYIASTRISLGTAADLARAEEAATEAIRLYTADPVDQQRKGELCLARIDLAAARLGRSDLEGAADEIDEVFEASGDRRTESVARRLRRFGATLDRPQLRGASIADELRERISASPIQPTPAAPTLIR